MNTHLIYRALIYIALYSILFVPFIVNSSLFFPFITGKAFTFYVLVEIALLFWVLLCFIDKEVCPRKGLLHWALFIFLGVLTVVDIFGVNPTVSVWSNYERMDGLFTMLHVGAFMLVLTSVIRSFDGWKYFFGTSVGASTIMALYALFEGIDAVKAGTSVIRVDTSFGNPIYLASYLLIHLFILAWFFVRTDSKFVRGLTAALAILHVIGLYFTSTRGAFVGLALGIFVMSLIIAIFAKKEKMIRIVGIGVLSVGILFGGLFFALKDSSVVQDNPTLRRIANSSISSGTGFSRYILWTEVAPKGIAERPLLGWGQGGFSVVFDKHYDPRLYHHEQWFDRSHNIFVDWLIIGGIIGFIAYFGLYGVALVLLFRNKKMLVSEKAIWAGALVAYVGQNLFVFDNLGNYILFFTLLAYIHFTDAKDNDTYWFTDKLKIAVSIAAIIIVSMTYWQVVAKPYASNADLIKAIQITAKTSDNKTVPRHPNGVQGNVDLFKKIVERNAPTGILESKERIMHASNQISSITNVNPELKNDMTTFMIEQQRSLQEIAPDSARYPFLLASYYINRGDNETAETEARRARELSPNKLHIRQMLIMTLLRQEKFDEAIAEAEEAYALNTELDEMWSLRMEVYRAAGKQDKLDEYMQEEFSAGNYTRLNFWLGPVNKQNALTPKQKEMYEKVKKSMNENDA